VDTAVSADGNYLVGVNINNSVVICGLTNGIPNAASTFTVNATGTTGNGRGIAWDAALNYYMSSSGIGAVQEWSLGITAKAITTGNASGQTNFALVLPATKVSVTATTVATSSWRRYGPLQVDWSNWQPMGGSLVAPILNAKGDTLYLAINCGARKMNATSAAGDWRTWDDPQADFERRLVNDLCSSRG
ncbi:MAG: hypothetical protein WCP63_13800, partial [Cyanobium sp. ELA712]